MCWTTKLSTLPLAYLLYHTSANSGTFAWVLFLRILYWICALLPNRYSVSTPFIYHVLHRKAQRAKNGVVFSVRACPGIELVILVTSSDRVAWVSTFWEIAQMRTTMDLLVHFGISSQTYFSLSHGPFLCNICTFILCLIIKYCWRWFFRIKIMWLPVFTFLTFRFSFLMCKPSFHKLIISAIKRQKNGWLFCWLSLMIGLFLAASFVKFGRINAKTSRKRPKNNQWGPIVDTLFHSAGMLHEDGHVS